MTIDYLERSGVNIKKIHEFTDQAPTQYKNCTTFNSTLKMKIPTCRHFFGARHGKNPTDRVTGNYKQWVKKEILSGRLVPRNTRILAEHTAALLEIQPKSIEYCHLRKKVIYHSKIIRKEVDDGIKPVNETRRIHAVRSIGLDGIVQVYNTDCCCKNCLAGGGNVIMKIT